LTALLPLRSLGRARLVAVGINSVIGGGIFILPAAVAALVGPASLLAYLAAASIVAGVGLTLATLAARTDRSGGPYSYVSDAFGPFAGFQVGWLFCLARLTAMANLMNGFARYLGTLAPRGGEPPAQALLVLVCAAAVVGVNVAGIKTASGAATALAILKVAPLLLLALVGFFYLNPERFALAPVLPADFLRAVLLLIYVFTGFEILTVPAEESLRPRRDMPFALLATIACVALVYLAVQTVALGILPDLSSQTAPLAAVAAALGGASGRYGMTMVAALSMAGCTLVSLVGATRLLYAMARSGQVPAVLGALGRRRRTPVVATFLFGGLAALLAIAGGYAELAAISAGTRMLIYLGCCGACLIPGAAGGAGRRIVAASTAALMVLLLGALERREILAGLAGLGCGTALYLVARRTGSPAAPRQGEGVA